MPGTLENSPLSPDWLVRGTWAGTQTPGGIRYAVLFDNLRVQYARDASQVVAWLRIRWADRDNFRKEMLGYTQWRGGAPYLDRYLAVPCPFDRFLRCETLDLKRKGCDPGRVTLKSLAADNWIDFDWAVYEATFRKPPYPVVEPQDGEVPFRGGAPGLEYTRYTSLRRQFAGRERRIPGLQFETVEATAQPIPEPAFVPDVTQTFYLTWWQVPAEAMPDGRIGACINTVNSYDFPLPLGNFGQPATPGTGITPATAKTFLAETEKLLFRGLAQPLDPYPGADGNLYFDPVFVFDYRPNQYGWNGYRKNNGTYVRLRVKGSASGTSPGTAPYPATDHRNMFVPGNT